MAGSNTFAATFVTAAGLLAAHAIMLRWIDRRDWAYVSLDAHAARPVVLARGWVLGALPMRRPSLPVLGIGWVVERTVAQGCWGWNWIMAVALHASVRGVAFEAPDYRMVDAGPDWITGGVWGPEGGAGAAAGMFVGLAYLYWRKKTQDERLQR